MFIVEGSDHLGKSTVCRKVIEEACHVRPAYYAHMTRPPELFDFRYDYLERMAYNVVQDRFHLGALVWHDNVMTKANLSFVERRLEEHECFVVVLYHGGDYATHLDGDDRDQMFDRKKLLFANSEYHKMATTQHPLKPKVDASWDISQGWVPELTIRRWVSEWVRRSSSLGSSG